MAKFIIREKSGKMNLFLCRTECIFDSFDHLVHPEIYRDKSRWSRRPTIGLFIPQLKAILHHAEGLIQSSWQEFSVFLKDTSAGQIIASKSAWIMVFQLELSCCHKAKANRNSKTPNYSRVNTGYTSEIWTLFFTESKGGHLMTVLYFFLNILPATRGSRYLNKDAVRHFFQLL